MSAELTESEISWGNHGLARGLSDAEYAELQPHDYRTVAQLAIDALRDATQEQDRLSASYHRLIDEYRHLRKQVLQKDL